jgi:protein-L-isoaspartate(D-aspartate) O-methyltransferase
VTPALPNTLPARLTAYARQLCDAGAIRTAAVAAAFAAVPRHLFVPGFYDRGQRIETGDDPPPGLLDRIYSDIALMTHLPADQAGRWSSTSQPSLVAKMIEVLDLSPRVRVLEIGAGTGYNAALIATITGGPVATIDVSAVVAAEAAGALTRAGMDTVTVICGDGYAGHPAAAPYDRIIVTCGCTGASPHWLTQLAPGGRMLVPVAHGGLHPVVAIARDASGQPHGHAAIPADFMTASGPLYHWPPGRTRTPDAPVHVTSLTRIPGTGAHLDYDRYQDLWFYLATRDQRITRAWTDNPGFIPTLGQCALHQPTTGTAWIHTDGSATLAGPTRLLDQLTSLINDWYNLGTPAISEWHCALNPVGQPGTPIHAPGHWHRHV